MAIVLGDNRFSIEDIVRIARFNEPVELHSGALARLENAVIW